MHTHSERPRVQCAVDEFSKMTNQLEGFFDAESYIPAEHFSLSPLVPLSPKLLRSPKEKAADGSAHRGNRILVSQSHTQAIHGPWWL